VDRKPTNKGRVNSFLSRSIEDKERMLSGKHSVLSQWIEDKEKAE
jgi:hypothetical protein